MQSRITLVDYITPSQLFEPFQCIPQFRLLTSWSYPLLLLVLPIPLQILL